MRRLIAQGKVIDQDGDVAEYSATVTVSLAPQTVTITSTPPNPALVRGTYVVSATGGASGNPVVFSSLTTSVCTVSGSTVRLVAVGTCTVAADQAGSASYAPAPQVTQSFAVVYAFAGFSQPVDNLPALNVATAGRTIPLKWRLTDASGAPVTTLTVATITVTSLTLVRGARRTRSRSMPRAARGCRTWATATISSTGRHPPPTPEAARRCTWIWAKAARARRSSSSGSRTDWTRGPAGRDSLLRDPVSASHASAHPEPGYR